MFSDVLKTLLVEINKRENKEHLKSLLYDTAIDPYKHIIVLMLFVILVIIPLNFTCSVYVMHLLRHRDHMHF